MKFERLGKINLTKKYSLNLIKYLENSKFKRLIFLLDFIEKETPQIYQNYIKQLKIIFNELAGEKKEKSENFRMTRFYTIAENDPYCDKVFHDLRKSKELEHPSTELIDSMGPLSKEHWRKDYFRK